MSSGFRFINVTSWHVQFSAAIAYSRNYTHAIVSRNCVECIKSPSPSFSPLFYPFQGLIDARNYKYEFILGFGKLFVAYLESLNGAKFEKFRRKIFRTRILIWTLKNRLSLLAVDWLSSKESSRNRSRINLIFLTDEQKKRKRKF